MPGKHAALEVCADKLDLSHLQAVIEDYVLGRLSTCQLGTLRGSCKAWQDLIDSALLGPLLPAAKHVLPEGLLRLLKTSLDLQAAARQQGRILRNIAAGSMRVQALSSSSSTMLCCTGWSQWSACHGHRWLTVTDMTHPYCVPANIFMPLRFGARWTQSDNGYVKPNPGDQHQHVAPREAA